MGSIANSKGGFYRTLEITRDSAQRSETTLMAPLIKNTDNYVVQVANFVSNATIPIHTFTEPLISVWRKPNINSFIQGAPLNSIDSVVYATPSNTLPVAVYRSPMEFARQLHSWVEDIDGLSVNLEPDGSLQITLTRAWGDQHYLKLSDDCSRLLGLKTYLSFFVSDYDPGVGPGYTPPVEQTRRVFATYLEFTERRDLYDGLDQMAPFRPDYYFLRPVALTNPTLTQGFDSGYSIDNLDTRDSIEIEMTLPHVATPLILDGVESRSKILARFPIRDYQVRSCSTTDNHTSYRVKERLMLGLEDFTRNNPDTHTMLMLPGEVHHANLRINTRYIEHKKFVVKPTDFGAHGFWSVKLLFAKKVK